jgi:hypothetical protein
VTGAYNVDVSCISFAEVVLGKSYRTARIIDRTSNIFWVSLSAPHRGLDVATLRLQQLPPPCLRWRLFLRFDALPESLRPGLARI